jgi:uncharacterized membrane protein
MKKQIQILLSGALIVVPLALTIWLIAWAAASLDSIGAALLGQSGVNYKLPPGVSALVVIVAIYLVGLLAQFVLFQKIIDRFEAIISRLPGIKTIYESTRDLMKLFGGDKKHMGKVVLYRQPATGVMILGIMTNDSPAGVIDHGGERRVAVYQPFSYMFGGPTVYVREQDVQEIPMAVDQALKLATTAHVGAKSLTDLPQPESNPQTDNTTARETPTE